MREWATDSWNLVNDGDIEFCRVDYCVQGLSCLTNTLLLRKSAYIVNAAKVSSVDDGRLGQGRDADCSFGLVWYW